MPTQTVWFQSESAPISTYHWFFQLLFDRECVTLNACMRNGYSNSALQLKRHAQVVYRSLPGHLVTVVVVNELPKPSQSEPT